MNNISIFLGAIGVWQIVIIIVAILFLFGGKKIPELMKGLGQGMKEFKKARNEMNEDDNKDEVKKEAIKD